MGNRFEALIQQTTLLWALLLTPASMLLGVVFFLDLSGARLQIYDMTADYLSGLVVAMAVLALLQFLPLAREHRKALSLLWLVRTGVTLGVMLPYDAIYAADALLYFHGGRFLSDPWAAFIFGNGTGNTVALAGIASSLVKSYSGLKVLWSCMGLVSVYLFYRAVVVVIGREAIGLLYLLGIFPSILFWSSILGKDPIVLLGIALFCYGAALLLTGRRGWAVMLPLVLGLLIASSIRIWLAGILLMPLTMTYILGGRATLTVKVGFLMIAVPGFLLAAQGFAEQFSIETARDLVERTDRLSRSWAQGGSAQQIEGGFSSIWSMLAFMPVGSFTALFRPLPGEVLNAFGLAAGIENAAVLLLLLGGLYRTGLTWRRDPVLLWVALTILVWASIYGFASYQNLGSAFRFRVQVAPLLLLFTVALNYGHLLGQAQAGAAEPPDPGDTADAERDPA